MNLMREQLRDALLVSSSGDNEFTAELKLSPDFVGFKGHFPGTPVLPGICIIAAVIVSAESVLGKDLKMNYLNAAKFFSPVEPGDRTVITGTLKTESAPYSVRAQINRDQERIAKVSLQVEPVTSDAQD